MFWLERQIMLRLKEFYYHPLLAMLFYVANVFLALPVIGDINKCNLSLVLLGGFTVFLPILGAILLAVGKRRVEASKNIFDFEVTRVDRRYSLLAKSRDFAVRKAKLELELVHKKYKKGAITETWAEETKASQLGTELDKMKREYLSLGGNAKDWDSMPTHGNTFYGFGILLEPLFEPFALMNPAAGGIIGTSLPARVLFSFSILLLILGVAMSIAFDIVMVALFLWHSVT
jgi:hypothetical protein